MEIKKYARGKNEYEFVCEYWETSYAWGHKVTMFKNGCEYNTNKVRYYNRTWENWTYQTAICGAIYNEIEKREKRLIEDYKYNNGIKRLKAEIKENIINADAIIKELKELKTFISNGNRGGEF